MENTVSKTLSLLGLSPPEIRLFLTCYRLGSATIPEITKTARIKRSTAYLLAQNLIAQGLLVEDSRDYAKKIQTVSPDQLLRMLSFRQRQLRRQELDFEEALPQLRSFYQASSIQPKVRLFEGNSGLLSVWQDILSSSGEILLWTNQQTESKFFGSENHNKFIVERIAKKLPIRVLATDSPQSRQLETDDAKSLRQTKILPPETVFSAETYIYDHKVAMLDYNKDIIGIITESLPLSEFQKAIFEMTWKQLP